MDEVADHSWLKQGSTSSTDIRRSYDDWAASYDHDLAEWDYQAPAKAAELLRDVVPPAGTILDAGCGTSLVAAALRSKGFKGEIDGIDLSPTSLYKARERNIYRDLQPANFQRLPLAIANDVYDALACIGVLTYVPDSQAILTEFARIVRSGGVVLVTQRDDLFGEREFDQTIQGLVDIQIFSQTVISEPKPYLPANPDFSSEIRVIYAVLTVA